MIKSQTEVYIHRPLNEVFEFLSNAENDPLWRDSMLKVKRVSEVNGNNHARYKFTSNSGIRTVSGELELRTIPGKKIIWQGTHGYGNFDGYYVFYGKHGGTKIKMIRKFKAKGIYSLLQPFLQIFFNWNARKQFFKLREVMLKDGNN